MRKSCKAIVAAMMLAMTSSPVISSCVPMTVYAAEKLDTPDNLGWDDDNECIAVWDEVEGAKQYEVYLYKESEDRSQSLPVHCLGERFLTAMRVVPLAAQYRIDPVA